MMENKLEMTYPMWKRWQQWMEENRTVNDAAEDPDSMFHRMATAEKMSRKRLRGLLMATGMSARTADCYLARVNAQGYSYLECWNVNKHTAILRIKNRFEASAEIALLRLIFDGEVPQVDPEKAVARRKSLEDKKREQFEKDKALIEAHPEITNKLEAHKAKMMYLISRITQKPDGTKVFESGALEMDKVREFSRLSLWYSFASWATRHGLIS